MSLFYFIKGYYDAPFRGRGYQQGGGYGPSGDLSEQEGYNDYPVRGYYRGFRGGRGRGRGRGSGQQRGGKNEKFVLNKR